MISKYKAKDKNPNKGTAMHNRYKTLLARKGNLVQDIKWNRFVYWYGANFKPGNCRLRAKVQYDMESK